MSLSDLASLGSFVSGAAVLVSLVFLYFQLGSLDRQLVQAEKNQRAALSQGYITRTADNLRWVVQSPVGALITRVEAGDATFTADELRQLSILLRLTVNNAQEAYFHHHAGLIDKPTYETAMNGLKSRLAHPVFRALAMQVLATNPAQQEFGPLVDKMIRETLLAKPVDAVARFNANLAKVVG